MKFVIMAFGLFFASSVFAKPPTPHSARKPNSDLTTTYKFSYDRSGPSLSFENGNGSPIGKYNSEFGLRMDDEVGYVAMDKFKNTEILITQWINGAATYNVRVFVPVSKNKEIKAQTEPICDVGDSGDTQNFSQIQQPLTQVVSRTVNGRKKSFLQIRTNKGYADCIELRNR